MDVNGIQIGGNHYKVEYEHWDLVCDTNLHYLLANATKYIYRWRKKNGIQDLRKASHYLSKAIERGVKAKKPILMSKKKYTSYINKFTDQLDNPIDVEVIDLIYSNGFEYATKIIDSLVLEEADHYLRG